MESISSSKKSLVNTIIDCAYKILVICLFLLMFLGRLNPARVSKNMSPSTSLVKTALYFKSYVKGILDFDAAATKEAAAAKEKAEDSAVYEDEYAEFLALLDENAFSQEANDDGEESLHKKAQKIKTTTFSNVWKPFEEKYSDLASALRFEHLSAILTFCTVLLVLLGLYFAFGTNKIKIAGYTISAFAAMASAFTMFLYKSGYEKFTSAPGAWNFNPIEPKGIVLFIVLALLVALTALAALFTQKYEKSAASSFRQEPFQYTYRILALILFVLLFIPGANPARISEKISRNVSLFTAAFSYKTYIGNLENILVRGYLPESVMRLGFFGSLMTCLGIIAMGAGSCMSVGNNKLKRIAHYTLFGGSLVSFLSLFIILRAYNLISSSPNIDKVLPLEPANISLYFVLFALVFVSALISFVKTPAPEKDEKCKIEAPYQLFLMLLPFLILVFIFSYLPLWGWRYAFFDYNAGDTLSMDSWVGWKWFMAPFQNSATRSDILRVLRNTLIMSGLGIAFSWLPMIFAIFLSEIRNSAARRVIQTLTTIPNFISWVLVYAIAFCIFGTEGFISSIMKGLGLWDKGRNMLMGDSHIWIKMWLWGTWKGLGWSAIMYIAAISGIDQQLYEAATVDGAGRFQKIWHITIPELLPTYIVLLILSVSGILSNGMDQYLVFKNPTNKDPVEVLDLYVYQLTFGATSNSNIPFSTVVSMFKSLVSVLLLFITNRISKWVRGSSIF